MKRELRVHCTDARVERTLESLERQWSRAVDLDALASAVNLTKSRLQHLFKEETGSSIGQWLRERRLVAAAELIAATDEHMAQVAYAVGYSDPSNFNHAFKSRFGMTPTEYREHAAGHRQA